MSNYKSWDIYTEIDYISLFIKTYLAFISTVKNITKKDDEWKAMEAYMGHYSFKEKLNFSEKKDFNNIKNLYLLGKNVFEISKRDDYLFSNFFTIYKDFSDTKIRNNIRFNHQRKNADIHWVFSILYRWDKLELKFKSEKIVYEKSWDEIIFDKNKEFKINENDIKKEKLYIKENFLEYLNKKNFYNNFSLDYDSNNIKIFLESEMVDYLDLIFNKIFPLKPFNNFENAESFNASEQAEVKKWLAWILKDVRNLVMHAYIDPLDKTTKELYKNWYNILRKILENNIDYLENNIQINENI